MGAAFLGPPFLDRLALPGQPNPRRRSIWTARASGLNQDFNFPNLCSHGSTDRFSLVRIVPMLEIPVALATRSSRAFGAPVHAAPCPSPDSGLQAGATSARPRPASRGVGHIRQPPLNVGLTHGVVCHFWPSPSRAVALTMPTNPWAPECMWRCRTSTVCLWPRRCRSRAWISSS
jgi:hypothetical protein